MKPIILLRGAKKISPIRTRAVVAVTADAVGIDSSPARIPGGHRQGSDLAPAAARLASE